MHQMDLMQWGKPHCAAMGALPHAQRLPHMAALHRRIAAEELEPSGVGHDTDRVRASHPWGSRVTATTLHHPAGPFSVTCPGIAMRSMGLQLQDAGDDVASMHHVPPTGYCHPPQP